MLEIIVVLGSVLVDQLTKAVASAQLTTLPGQTFPIIDQILHFTYCENTGAAFSIFRNNTLFLTILVSILVVVLAVIMVKFRKAPSKLLKTSLALIMGGAIGNLIDRVILGYVVDFIDFRVINFPVFNVADICVCIGTALLVIYVFSTEWKKREPKADEGK